MKRKQLDDRIRSIIIIKIRLSVILGQTGNEN